MMHRGNRLTIGLVVLGVLGVVLAGCGPSGASADPPSPAQLAPVQGSNLSRVTLTAEAVERIGLQTASVQQLPAPDTGATMAVPLKAVLYLSDGTTWVYAVTAARSYVRQSVTIARISGDNALLRTGPAPGTDVVTTGAAELLGSELGVAGGQ
jgi:hypothetical protein